MCRSWQTHVEVRTALAPPQGLLWLRPKCPGIYSPEEVARTVLWTEAPQEVMVRRVVAQEEHQLLHCIGIGSKAEDVPP